MYTLYTYSTLYIHSICALYTDGIGRVAMGRGRVGAVIKSPVSQGRATATMTSSLILTWVIFPALWRMYKALLRISRVLLRIHRALIRIQRATISLTNPSRSHLHGCLAVTRLFCGFPGFFYGYIGLLHGYRGLPYRWPILIWVIYTAVRQMH